AARSRAMIRRSALGHRTRGVTAPLAPRAGIQGRTAQARQLHGENVMARGNSRAAIMNHLVARHLAQQACELVAQQLWRFKATVVAHVLRNGTVQRTVNPTGDRVDGFVFTTVAFGCTRINQMTRTRSAASKN